MSETVQTRISQVFDPEGKRPYNIKTDDGKRYDTFKSELGEAAKGLVGQFGSLTFSVRQNGEYTNYVYEGFEPAKTLDNELIAGGAGSASNEQARPQSRLPLDPAEQAAIRRAVALDRATDFLPYLKEEQRTVSGVLAIGNQFVTWLEGKEDIFGAPQ